jgi:hypothetical protein
LVCVFSIVFTGIGLYYQQLKYPGNREPRGVNLPVKNGFRNLWSMVHRTQRIS